jgi:hypothetical protein
MCLSFLAYMFCSTSPTSQCLSVTLAARQLCSGRCHACCTLVGFDDSHGHACRVADPCSSSSCVSSRLLLHKRALHSPFLCGHNCRAADPCVSRFCILPRLCPASAFAPLVPPLNARLSHGHTWFCIQQIIVMRDNVFVRLWPLTDALSLQPFLLIAWSRPTLESPNQLTCINFFMQMVSDYGSSLSSSLSSASHAQ